MEEIAKLYEETLSDEASMMERKKQMNEYYVRSLAEQVCYGLMKIF